MINRVATIILNRNLPEPTDKLVEHLMHFDGEYTDVFVVEAGSDLGKLSKYCTWHANWDDVNKSGLRYSRGMNFGLSQLWSENSFEKYDAFFLLTNDTEFESKATIKPLVDELNLHPRVGILSPCSMRWGERLLLKDTPVKYFWFIHNNAYLLRKEFILSICNNENPNLMDFLFDGSNFRGYLSESELIAKAYANDWAAAITRNVIAEENESYLHDRSDSIKTEDYNKNLKLYVEEGEKWVKKKYGFNSRWSMQQYVKSFYDTFFEFHPEFNHFKI
jgi:hypothetical protein